MSEEAAEVPNRHIANLAGQFLRTAELLLANVPNVVAPAPLRASAAFAIELYIKSLNSRWKSDDETYLVSTHS